MELEREGGQRGPQLVRGDREELGAQSKGPPECLLGLPLRSDVGVGSEPARDGSARVSDWLRTRKKPTVIALAIPKREGVLPRLPALEVLGQLHADPLDVLRVMDQLPAPTPDLLQGRAGVLV